MEDEKGGKEKLSFRSILTWRIIENSNKIAKKFKKLDNTIMALFQAEMGRRRLRKEKIKINVSFRTYLTRCRKFHKNSKKNKKKKKKNHYGFISSQNSFEMAKKERK